MPFNIMIFSMMAYIFIVNIDRLTTRKIVKLAILAGLGVMTRFDFLPIALTLGLVVWFMNPTKKTIFPCVYFLVFVSVISPWIVYSKIHFGTLFIADNGRRIINIVNTTPTTFFSRENPALVLTDNPLLWLKNSCYRWGSALGHLYNYIGKYTFIREIIMGILLLLFFKVYKMNISKTIIVDHMKKNKVAYIILLLASSQTVAILLTGYPDERYHILFVTTLFYIVLYFISAQFTLKINSKKNVVFFILIFMLTLNCKTENLVFEKSIYHLYNLKNSKTYSALHYVENDGLLKYLENIEGVRLILNTTDKSIDVPKFAALSGNTTILIPNNLSTENAKEFIEYFKGNYLYSSDEKQIDIFKSTMKVIKTEIPNLYKLELINP